jgi:hypothetical protein
LSLLKKDLVMLFEQWEQREWCFLHPPPSRHQQDDGD